MVREVVVTCASKFRRKAQPDEVTVLASGELRRWLKKRPQMLDAETFSSIYERAKHGEIWTK